MRAILGIDPGLVNTGWAIINSESSKLQYIDSGTIKTNSKDEIAQRLSEIYNAVLGIINIHNPLEMAIEDSFVNNNPMSSLKLGQARAASILAAGNNEMKVFEYAPRLVKKAVVGSGKADKNQIIAMVKYLMPSVTVSNDHEADALAVAICHSHISSTAQRMNIT